MRFAAMGSPSDGYTYDEIDIGGRSAESPDAQRVVRLRKGALVDSLVEAFPAGAYTRPPFGSTQAHSVGQGCCQELIWGCLGGVRG
jgi:hypothetical protein